MVPLKLPLTGTSTTTLTRLHTSPIFLFLSAYQMMGDKEIPKKASPGNASNKKKKKKRGGSKRKMTSEQSLAYNCVSEWVFLEQRCGKIVDDDFLVPWNQPKEKLVFELHCHSVHSDGFLSASKVVERAHQNGVSFLSYFIKFQSFFFSCCGIGIFFYLAKKKKAKLDSLAGILCAEYFSLAGCCLQCYTACYMFNCFPERK